MSKINAVCIKNPFQPRLKENRDERSYDYNSQTIREIFCDYYPIPNPDVEIVASINGHIYDAIDWDHKLSPNDNLVFVPVPKGGGGGSNVMAMVAMIAVAVISWGAGSLAYGAMYSAAAAAGAGVSSAAVGAMYFASGLISAAIMIGGGMLVSSIFPTKIPDMNTSLEETSPTYGWGTFNNTSQEGTALPIILGERRVAPPIIASHSESINDESYLYLLYAVSEGPIESIYGIEINEQPMSYYSDAEVIVRLGHDSQEIVPYFNDTYSDSNVSLTLNSTSYVTRETSGTGVDAAQIHLALPQGLWHARNNGKFDEQTMVFSIQYRKKGASTWLNYVATSESSFELYNASKVYNPNEVVIFNGNSFKCINYLVDREVKTHLGDGDYVTSTEYGVAVNNLSVKKTFNMHSHQKILNTYNTPIPTNTTFWEPLYENTSLAITGSSTTFLSKTYRINFPVRGQYEMRCLIQSGPPENNPRYGSKAVWSGITEIITDDFTYPGVALLGLKIKASEQLSGGIPKVTCIAKNIYKRFDVAGITNLNNPASAVYYILTNKVWGGRVDENDVILSEFVNWYNFCVENEITCSLYIDQSMTYNTVKNYFCEIGRANVVQYGTKYGVIIDKETVASQLFTIGNIIKDSFKMDYLPMDDRANCIRVNYYDKDYNWEKSTVELRTQNYISNNKEVSQDVTLYTCDNKETAAKHGTLLLNYNKHLLRTCSFDVSIDALACTVGDVILVQHDVTYYGFGGRIVDIVGNTVTIDRAISLGTGKTYGFLVRNSNNDVIENSTFTVHSDGEYSTITLNTPVSAGIDGTDVYSIGELNIEAKPFRIISISRSQEFTRKITALEYYPQVYNDEAIVESVPMYANYTKITGLIATEVFDNDYAKTTKVKLSWLYQTPNASFIVKMKDDNNSEVIIGKTSMKSFEIPNVPIGVLVEFTVQPENTVIGKSSVSGTFWGEGNAIYENGFYEHGVFVTPQLQQIIGTEPIIPLWIQEPNEVLFQVI